MSKKKPKTIDASCPVTLMGCEGEVIVEMTPTEAVSMLEKAWQENKRLRQENATITAERDEARFAAAYQYAKHHNGDVQTLMDNFCELKGWQKFQFFVGDDDHAKEGV